MDKLRAMQLFVRLAELGSFTQVAEQTHVSKSMISKEIRRLEEELGARLLHRSTRHIQLTHLGEGYLKRARDIIAMLDDADAFIKEGQQGPKGRLKINAPMALGITRLSSMFADFMRAYPDIELDIHLGDEEVDLVQQGFDLGFRASSQALDSLYVGRPLTEFSYHVCASQGYLDTHPAILSTDDLQSHPCFVYSYFKGKNTWPIDEGVVINGSLRVNSVLFMLEVIKSGLGLGFLPEFACRDALKSGDLVEVLAHTKKPKLTLFALYPARHFVPPATQVCIAFLEDWFRNRG